MLTYKSLYHLRKGKQNVGLFSKTPYRKHGFRNIQIFKHEAELFL